MHFDPPVIMSVDNASVAGMDFTELLADDPDLYHIMWRDGRGELERQDLETGGNLNGLRETFIDIIPYAPLFQQFLTKLKAKNLLLPQAKKVQIDLINQVFESKRQAPFHYPVAAGDYWWDASDETMGASTNAALQNTIAKLNEVISRLNALVTSLLNGQLIAEINSNIVNGVNSNVVGGSNSVIVAVGNSLVSHINSQIVGPTNSALSEHNAYHKDIGNHLITYVNGTMIPNLQRTDMGGGTAFAAAPGMGQGASFGETMSDNTSWCSGIGDGFGNLSGINGVNALGWSTIASVAASNQQWIPIGATAPVNVTPAEQAAIMSGIAARTNDLNLKRNTKIAEVNALTTVDDVIAYDVTTGW
jgi:hypothetical protein